MKAESECREKAHRKALLVIVCTEVEWVTITFYGEGGKRKRKYEVFC